MKPKRVKRPKRSRAMVLAGTSGTTSVSIEGWGCFNLDGRAPRTAHSLAVRVDAKGRPPVRIEIPLDEDLDAQIVLAISDALARAQPTRMSARVRASMQDTMALVAARCVALGLVGPTTVTTNRPAKPRRAT